MSGFYDHAMVVPTCKIAGYLNHEHWREPTAGCSEIGRLTLVKACCREQDLTVVDIEPHIGLASLQRSVELDHPLARRGELLSHIATTNDFRPDALRHLVPAIDSLA